MLDSKTGDLTLNTGDFIFQDYIDADGFKRYLKLKKAFDQLAASVKVIFDSVSGLWVVTSASSSSSFFLDPVLQVAGPIAVQRYEACLNAGGSQPACGELYYSILDAYAKKSSEIFGGSTDIVVDATPLIGDIAGLAECVNSPSALTCGAGIVGIFGPIGDGVKAFLRYGDTVLEVTRKADGTLDVAPASADDWARIATSDWRPVSGVGARFSTPTGFKTLRKPNGDIVHESPAGLRYGPDPNFGNRVEHVLAHTRPDPSKANHTVFNVQGDDALDLVDEAWAVRGVPEPNDPSAFVIDLGRPIGTNGETSVRIVVDTSTNSVVTAYPQ